MRGRIFDVTVYFLLAGILTLSLAMGGHSHGDVARPRQGARPPARVRSACSLTYRLRGTRRHAAGWHRCVTVRWLGGVSGEAHARRRYVRPPQRHIAQHRHARRRTADPRLPVRPVHSPSFNKKANVDPLNLFFVLLFILIGGVFSASRNGSGFAAFLAN